MKYQWPAFFLPEWLTIWIVIVAVALAILGLKRLAGMLALIPLFDWFVIPLAAPLLELLPVWLIIVFVVFLCASLLNGVLSIFVGREAAGLIVGTYLIRSIDLLFKSALRMFRYGWGKLRRAR